MTEQNKQYALDIANTILDQLGNGMFKMMTGAKKFCYSYNEGNPYLQFCIGSNPKHVCMVRVTYMTGPDTYTMDFYKKKRVYPIKGNREVNYTDIINTASLPDVYCDTLRQVFTDNTGLETYF